MPKQEAVVQIINVNLEILRENLAEKSYYDSGGKNTGKASIDYSQEFSLINDIEILLMQLQ